MSFAHFKAYTDRLYQIDKAFDDAQPNRLNRHRHLEPDSAGLRIREEVKSLFEALFQKLREGFDSGTASPRDHTPENLTILHVSQQTSCFSDRVLRQ